MGPPLLNPPLPSTPPPPSVPILSAPAERHRTSAELAQPTHSLKKCHEANPVSLPVSDRLCTLLKEMEKQFEQLAKDYRHGPSNLKS